jgi:O-antigen/teichoic acid export membrane protein
MLKLKKLDNRVFFTQVSVVAGGAFISQVINLVTLLILTRLYTPQDFGIFGTYSAIVTLSAVISGLRYELAISLPKRKETAANILTLTVAIVIIFSFLILIAVVVTDLLGLFPYLELFSYSYAIPYGVAAAGLYQTIIYWAMRHREFESISKSRVLQATILSVAQLAFVCLGAGVMGLIAGIILSHLAGAVLLIGALSRDNKWLTLRQVTGRRMRWLAMHLQRFPKFSVLEGLAAAAATQLPIIVFAASFTSTYSGQFVLALLIAQAPLRLFGSAMGQVLFSRTADAKRDGDLVNLMLSGLRMLARLGIAPLLMTATIAPELFALVFGETWRVAGTYVTWLTPILALEFIVAPLSVAVVAIETRLITLFTRMLLIGVPIIGLYFTAMSTGDPIMAAASYSITGCLTYLAYGSWLMYVTKVSQRIWIKILTIEILLAFIPFLLLLGLKLLIDPAQFNLQIVSISILGICAWYYMFSRKIF